MQPSDQDQAAPGVQARQHTPTPTPDAERQGKYGEASRFLWFQYTPAQVAAWYNARHTVDDLLDFDRTGMASAEALGRLERTPSVGSTRDRQHWADFGAAAREDDGRPTGGDVLELRVRTTSGQSKAQVLRELGREMVAEARAELESVASGGSTSLGAGDHE